VLDASYRAAERESVEHRSAVRARPTARRPRQACAAIAAGARRLMTACVLLVAGNTLPVWRFASGLPCCLLVSQHWLR
jgi:hypothetical protein